MMLSSPCILTLLRPSCTGTEEHGGAGDYTQDAVNYLLDSGMTAQEIHTLRNMITKG